MEDDIMAKDCKIECVLRKYHIHIPGGSVLEVESTKSISEEGTKMLLEEDNGISNFFRHYKITGYLRPVIAPIKARQENEPRPDPAKPLTPRQRVNLLLEMKGEFTRNDYMEYMKGLGYDATKWMIHCVVNDAIRLKRLELTDDKGRLHKYKVVDPTPADESLFKQLLRDRRLQTGKTQ